MAGHSSPSSETARRPGLFVPLVVIEPSIQLLPTLIFFLNCSNLSDTTRNNLQRPEGETSAVPALSLPSNRRPRPAKQQPNPKAPTPTPTSLHPGLGGASNRAHAGNATHEHVVGQSGLGLIPRTRKWVSLLWVASCIREGGRRKPALFVASPSSCLELGRIAPGALVPRPSPRDAVRPVVHQGPARRSPLAAVAIALRIACLFTLRHLRVPVRRRVGGNGRTLLGLLCLRRAHRRRSGTHRAGPPILIPAPPKSTGSGSPRRTRGLTPKKTRRTHRATKLLPPFWKQCTVPVQSVGCPSGKTNVSFPPARALEKPRDCPKWWCPRAGLVSSVPASVPLSPSLVPRPHQSAGGSREKGIAAPELDNDTAASAAAATAVTGDLPRVGVGSWPKFCVAD
jgi:hypothetical protein